MKERINTTRTVQEIEDLINKRVINKKYIIKNLDEKRVYDLKTSDINTLASVLGTLIKDLIEAGIIKGD